MAMCTPGKAAEQAAWRLKEELVSRRPGDESRHEGRLSLGSSQGLRRREDFVL